MAKRTKEDLAQAFRQLLMCKPLDKIMIRDIVAAASVSRQTFYYYFQDIYDLLEWVFQEDLQQLGFAPLNQENWRHNLKVIMDYMLENRALVVNALHSVGRDQIERFFHSTARPIFAQMVESTAQKFNVAEEDRRDLTDLYAFCFTGLLLEWVRRGMKVAPEREVARLGKLLDGTLEYILSRCDQNR